jgi:hypothetical protein
MRSGLFDRRRRLSVVGLVLCLLAALFAFEAKIAWFSPAGTPSAQISATKLQPADAPRLIARALAAPVSQRLAADPSLLLAVALLLAPKAPFAFRESARDRIKVYASSSFSPPMFRRPPPHS